MKLQKKLFLGVLAVLTMYAVFVVFLFATYDREKERISWKFPFPEAIFVPAWERKIDLADTAPLKIGLITDSHIKSVGETSGDLINRYLKESYITAANDYVKRMESFDPAFHVHLGDIIEGSDAEEIEARTNFRLFRELFEPIDEEIYWVIGNHDTRSLTRPQFKEVLDIDYIEKSWDVGPYRFIIADFNYKNNDTPNSPENGDYIPGSLTDKTRAWLEEQLDTTQHVIMFTHHPFVASERLDKNAIREHEEMRVIAEKYGVIAAFHGHVEIRHFSEEGGVEYYVLPGTKKNPLYPAANYALTLDKGNLEIDMQYRDPETDKIITEPFVTDGKIVDYTRWPAEEK